MSEVIVIGAGPAGMMAAGFAASRGLKVRLFDRNGFAGKKLNITGKGRCNVTNECDRDEFMRNIPKNGKFLYSAFSVFTPNDVIAFFEGLGVELKTERGRRVFPVSERARDITDALVRWLGAFGVKVEKKRVDGLIIENGAVTGVRCYSEAIAADAVVIATGGLSYPLTGSDGDGYRLAREAGHIVSALEPSLVSLHSPNTFCAEMQGLSLRNVTLSLIDSNGRTRWKEGPGEMLFTHFGISGPLVLSVSAHWEKGDSLSIDLKPGIDEQELDARLLRDFTKFANRETQNALNELLPRAMIPVIIEKIGISSKRVNLVTREERRKLLEIIKRFPVSVSGKAQIDEAVITRGGVCVDEIDPKTMRSKLVDGLYFAGEVLDTDAYTGGFNLQIAWSTGRACGMGIEV